MDKSKILKLLKPGRIIYPIAIGLLVAGFLLFKDFNKDTFSNINWTWHSGVWCLAALMMVALRDLAYIYRIRILTDKELTWKKGFQVIMLWEFASAVTPSAVGGSPVAIFIIHREKINIGKSTAIVMVTSLLDELFYVIMVPLVYFTVGSERIFSIAEMSSLAEMTFGYGLFSVFIIGYFIIFTYCLIILYALFYKPRVIKWLL